MRGNPKKVLPALARTRSIPAHAGQPVCRKARIDHAEVYPRACGATMRWQRGERGVEGLSPRMRGNRTPMSANPTFRRSIPAHAGQPAADSSPGISFWVYPRACGATASNTAKKSARRGLSPRMRGNLAPESKPTVVAGSIPAHAGQPNRARS